MSNNNFVGSRIRYSSDGSERQGHLMALLPLSRPDSETGDRALQEFRLYVELSGFLAFQHVQRRSGEVLPGLPAQLEGCDFTWTYRHHDTQFSPLQAAREVMSYELPQGSSQAQPWTRPANNDYWSIPVQPITNNNTITTSDNHVVDPNNNNNYGTIAPEEEPTTTTAAFASTPSPTATATATVSTAAENDVHWQIFLEQQEEDDPPRTAPPRLTDAPQRTAAPQRTDPPRTQAPWATVPPRTAAPQQQFNNRQRQRYLIEEQQQQPFAILGAARSVTSQAIGILGSAFELPQISSSSTASNLDELPFFSRTVPTNEGDAHATIVYLRQQLGVSHVGVLHSEDSWGRRYEQDLQYYGNRYGVSVKSVAYSDDNLGQAMMQLEQTNLRYFIGIINSGSWKPVIQAAYDYGLMGNLEKVWFIGDLVELVGDGFELDRETERDIAVALHGTGVIFLQVTPHTAFDQALAAVAENRTLQQEFIDSHSDSWLLDNFTFSPSPGMSVFQYLTYDAVVALGITACNTPGLFTGQEFYDQLLQVDFEGVSGRVTLNNDTGTRLGDSLRYQIVNLALNDYLNSTSVMAPTMTFTSTVSSSIELSPPNGTQPMVHFLEPFMYHDNSTNPPLSLPPLHENMNLIPTSVLGIGLFLAVSSMTLSVAIGVWVLRNRSVYVIRASQPFFLVQLVVGTFILASTIIPLGWQEPKPKVGIDVACASLPWTFCIGIVVIISALFCKARRINQVMNTGTGFRRIRIKPQDVMRPTLIILAVNILLLTAWTASPWRMRWERTTVENHVDQFGRTEESYGVCRPDSNWHFLFSAPLWLTNTIVLGMATFQSYRARNLPSEFGETAYMAISMVFLSEIFFLGVTMVFPVLKQPTAFYLLASILIFVGSMAILGPMFLPKFSQRNTLAPRGRMSTSVVARRKGSNSRNRSGISSSALGSSGVVGISGLDTSMSQRGSDHRGSDRLLLNSAGSFHSSIHRHKSSGSFPTPRNSAEIAAFGSSSSLRASSGHHVRVSTANSTGARALVAVAALSTTREEEHSSSRSFG